MKDKRFLSIIMLIAILFSTFIRFSSNVFAAGDVPGFVYMEMQKYIENNSSQIKFEDGEYLAGLETLDTKSYDLFLTGEVHATKKNYDLRFAFLKYLNQNANVRYYVAEMDYATSYLINEYLKTGNEEIFKYCYNGLKGSFAGTNEEYKFWKKVYEYNKSLLNENKITIIGIDVEYEMSLDVLYYIVGKRNNIMPNEIKDTLFKLYNIFHDFKYSYFKDVMLSLNEDIESKRELYKEFLKDEFEDFEHIVRNTVFSINYGENIYPKLGTLNNERENFMCQNFIELSKRFNDGKYFGQFGAQHIFQDSIGDNIDRLASRIKNSSSKFKNKVCSILYIYQNSKYMDRKTGEPGDILLTLSNKINIQDNVLCKFLNNDNIFNKYNFMGVVEDQNTTNYIQYALILHDSLACTKFDAHLHN